MGKQETIVGVMSAGIRTPVGASIDVAQPVQHDGDRGAVPAEVNDRCRGWKRML